MYAYIMNVQIIRYSWYLCHLNIVDGQKLTVHGYLEMKSL